MWLSRDDFIKLHNIEKFFTLKKGRKLAWTDEKKQKAIEMYEAEEPTPENSSEIVKSIAEQLEESPNGVRMILVKAGVYVKKEGGSAEPKEKKASTGTGRVSKEAQISLLKETLKNAGAEVNDEILDKLTGKAAAYFVEVFKSLGK